MVLKRFFFYQYLLGKIAALADMALIFRASLVHIHQETILWMFFKHPSFIKIIYLPLIAIDGYCQEENTMLLRY